MSTLDLERSKSGFEEGGKGEEKCFATVGTVDIEMHGGTDTVCTEFTVDWARKTKTKRKRGESRPDTFSQSSGGAAY